jgi:hypothetical protein
MNLLQIPVTSSVLGPNIFLVILLKYSPLITSLPTRLVRCQALRRTVRTDLLHNPIYPFIIAKIPSQKNGISYSPRDTAYSRDEDTEQHASIRALAPQPILSTFRAYVKAVHTARASNNAVVYSISGLLWVCFVSLSLSLSLSLSYSP